MPAPVLPSDFEAIIVQPEDDLCTGLKKTLIQLPILIYKLWSWMFNADGTISQDYLNELCPKVYPADEQTEET